MRTWRVLKPLHLFSGAPLRQPGRLACLNGREREGGTVTGGSGMDRNWASCQAEMHAIFHKPFLCFLGLVTVPRMRRRHNDGNEGPQPLSFYAPAGVAQKCARRLIWSRNAGPVTAAAMQCADNAECVCCPKSRTSSCAAAWTRGCTGAGCSASCTCAAAARCCTAARRGWPCAAPARYGSWPPPSRAVRAARHLRLQRVRAALQRRRRSGASEEAR